MNYSNEQTDGIGLVFSLGNIKISMQQICPLICAAATFKYIYNYYCFIFPGLTSVFVALYNVVTLLMLVLFIPFAIKALSVMNKKQYRTLLPGIIIPLCVVSNILYVMFSSGNFSILSRTFNMALANGTNDAVGFYFAQINTWFGNMCLFLILAMYIRNKTDIVKCIVSTMSVLVLPILLIIVTHPSYLGLRQSSFDDGSSFSGGLWNIGVVGFGSVSWLGLALKDYSSKWQQRLILFSVVLFAFVGVAGISRTLILMLVFSFGFYFVLARKNVSWLWKILLIIVLVALFCVLETNFVASLMFRFHDSTSGSNNIRIKLWKAYLSHYREVWLVGAPLGSVYNYYRDVDLFGAHFLPHSAVINFFVRYGIVAAISYLTLLKNSFMSIRTYNLQVTDEKLCVLAGGIAYITLAFINQTGYAEAVFYIMFGLLIAYNRITYQDGLV